MVIGVVGVGEGGDAAPTVVRPQEVVRQRLAGLGRILERGVEVRADRNGVDIFTGDQVIGGAAHVGGIDGHILDLLLDAEAPVHGGGRAVEAEQVVDAAGPDGAAAGGVGIQVAVVEGGAEGHRRIAVGVHGRVALQAILEHAGAAANGGLAGAEDIPGEADAGAEVHRARGIEAARVAVLAADGRAVRYRAGARNERADQRIGIEGAGARIDRHALAVRIDDRHVQHGGVGAVVERGVETGDGLVGVGLRRQVIEAHAEVEGQALADAPVVLNVEFQVVEDPVAIDALGAFRIGLEHSQQRVGIAVAAIERVGGGGAEVERTARIGAAHLELLGVLDVDSRFETVRADHLGNVVHKAHHGVVVLVRDVAERGDRRVGVVAAEGDVGHVVRLVDVAYAGGRIGIPLSRDCRPSRGRSGEASVG